MNLLLKVNILDDLVCRLLFTAGIISLLDEEEPQLKVGNCFCVLVVPKQKTYLEHFSEEYHSCF